MSENKTNNKAELVFIIFNVGYEQLISDIAKDLNISGGTFINAHGLSKFEAEKFFNIAIESEKNICLLVINSNRRNEILKTFYEKAGLGSEAQGIAFSLPVEGLSENLKKQLFSENKGNNVTQSADTLVTNQISDDN